MQGGEGGQFRNRKDGKIFARQRSGRKRKDKEQTLFNQREENEEISS